MPATPPLAFEHKSAPKADPTLTTYPGTGTPFDIKYDVSSSLIHLLEKRIHRHASAVRNWSLP